MKPGILLAIRACQGVLALGILGIVAVGTPLPSPTHPYIRREKGGVAKWKWRETVLTVAGSRRLVHRKVAVRVTRVGELSHLRAHLQHYFYRLPRGRSTAGTTR